MPDPHDADRPEDHAPESPTAAIRLIAMVAFFAAVYFLSSLLVPFLLALVLAIALSPVANWIERKGAGRTLASLACMLFVALFLAGTVSLVAYQAGAILQDGDKYIDRLGDLSARAIRTAGGEDFLQSIVAEEEAPSRGGGEAGEVLVAKAKASIRRESREIGRWAMTGLGGLFGFLGNTIIFLAFLFYMLQGRSDWLERLRKTALGLGMRPRQREFAQVATELKTYIGTLAMVSAVYAVVISAALWLIGIPQPILWGVLTGLLELIPFFGPVIAGALPTLAALGAGGGTWQPIAVIALFVVLQTLEGYVVAPLLYGKAVEIEPVTVLFGVLFFGWLLGPAGLTLAMPLMILLRGVLIITPDTPALDALADTDAASRPSGQ